MKFLAVCLCFAVFVSDSFGCNSLMRRDTPYKASPAKKERYSSIKGLPYSKIRRGPPIWRDEFDHLDHSKWTPMISGWRGSNAFQIYVNRSQNMFVFHSFLCTVSSEIINYLQLLLQTFRGIENSYVRDADRYGPEFLYNGTIDLTLEGCNVNWGGGCIVKSGDDIIPPIQSARIHTRNSFSFTYGFVEVRAKMPKGDWIWPAVWMSPTDSVYGSNPRSGEIDITEVRSNVNLSCGSKSYGRQLCGTSLHWGPDSHHNGHRVQRNPDFSSDFHIFAMEWLPIGFNFYVDDDLIGHVSPPEGGFWKMGGFEGQNIWNITGNGTRIAPFDHPFHFILDVAVGGDMFPDWCINQPFDQPLEKPWKISDPVQMRPFWEKRMDWLPTWNPETEDNAMRIDYIRVYAVDQHHRSHG
ncbi:hypothetical protein OUZ56_019989 [Daphnia magna]|uniref:GH16 domain-containing protein n=1 Tax=Daphnia magna TaxID=35525 RepID=A0ABQ9ZD72_9CRUS|nr:hypothetical protein OUZ56_019989 [Daphnia magna]